MTHSPLTPSSNGSYPFLGPEDPSSFQVLNADGRTSVILVCDHASNLIPSFMNNLGIGPEIMNQHVAWDLGAAEVTRRLSRLLDAPAVLAGYSRLIIDCNRPPGDPTSIPEVSDGIVIPGNLDLDEAQAELRMETFFWPYHHAITNILAHLWRHEQAPALVAIHSFTPEMSGFARPWQVGILWNRDPRLALPVMERLRTAHPDLCVGDNEPYSGREVGFTMETHAGAAGLPHVEFEIRQDQLISEADYDHWANIIADTLKTVLADKTVHRVVHF